MSDFHYSPVEYLPDAKTIPESRSELRAWLDEKTTKAFSEIDSIIDDTVHSRLYIVESIRYDHDTGLTQKGNAPGFFGGVWTLATCKKKMRKERDFKSLFTDPEDGIRRPTVPIVILGCGSRAQKYPKPKWAETRRNWLAFAAVVTHGFDTMEAYNRHLTANYSGEAVRDRRTHASDASEMAKDRGDLHVDDDGTVKYPPVGHQHGPSSTDNSSSSCGCSSASPSDDLDPYDHKDNQTDHVKCFAEPGMWTAWQEPKFAVKPEREFFQNNPDPSGLDTILDWFMETKPVSATA